MSNVTIPNLPSVTSLSGSSQLQVVQNGTSYRATAQQIANLNANGGTVTSITAQNPLSGGTITTTGTIGLNNNGVTNTYLAQMPGYTVKGNNTSGSAQPIDMTAAQFIAAFGVGTVTSIATGTGLSGGPITTTGTISIAATGVTSGTYGSASTVPVVTVNSQGQLTVASNINISIPSGQVTGLGTMATQNANAVAITGGNINGTVIGGTTPAAATFTALTATGSTNLSTVASGTWNGSTIAVAYGGTGATTATGARTNLSAAQSGANSDITSLSGLTTPLSETQGGTGYGSYTTGDILYASSSSTLARLNDVATGNALISGGAGVAPFWGKIGLTTHVSGTLPVANGGTGATTLTGYLVGNGTGAFTTQATIPNAGLTNSSVTIGSTSIALGASTSTLAGLTTVTVTQDPTASLQLSTKQYVDNQVATVSNTTFHTASAAATTANLTATYNNGTAGVGATLTNSGAQAAFAVDGYTASLNDRILVKDQTTGAQNGIYTVTTLGSGSTNWVLTRATDFNTVGTGPNFIETGASTFVQGGTTWGSTSWVMNTTGTITVGSTALVWVQTSSSGNITVSAPITKTGNTIGLGTVGVSFGGTGLTALTAYGLLYAASTSSVGQISPSTTGYPLLSTGASTAPAFGQLSLTAGVTGTLPVGNGGTGTATAFTTGSAIFAGASGVYTQNNSKYFWDNTNFRLGLNTATPQTTLNIVAATQTTTPTASLPAGTDLYIVGANATNTRITQDAYGTGSYGAFTARMARGTAASPTASQSGDFLVQFTARGYGATGFGTASTGYLAFSAAENFTDTAQGTYAGIYTTPTGSNSIVEAFRFGPAGQLGIGGATYGTSGYVLTSGGASAAPTWSQVSLTSSVTGTLPATNGGTGQSSYAVGDLLYASSTTALSRLADVATGNVLLSGGVGVAPSWGQVSLSTAVTGTLPAANGGTGNNTYTIGDLLYASGTTTLSRLADVATGSVLVSGGTGTAPAWSSTPTVSTLNYTTSVGSTSMTVPLVIGGTAASSTLTLESTSGTGTSDSIIFKTGSQSTRMTIDTSGNVGIGTTSPSTYGTFVVKGSNSPLALVNDNFMNINLYSYRNAVLHSILYTYGARGTEASPLALTSGDISFRIQAEGHDGSAFYPTAAIDIFADSAVSTGNVPQAIRFLTGTTTTQSERMRIDSSGNVGIGTSSPSGFKLNVSDGTTNFVINPSSAIGYIGTTGSYPVAFLTNNTEKMRLDTSGNLGIGITSPRNVEIARSDANTSYGVSANQFPLNLRNTDTTSNNWSMIGFNQGASSLANPVSIGAQLTSTTAGSFVVVTSSSERLRVDSSGNVGIGNSSPAVPLQIGNGTASATIRFGATSNGFDIGRDNSTGYYIQNATQASPYNQFIWQQSGTERMRIDGSGNVSIGSSGTATGVNLLTNALITGATTAYAHLNSGVIQSGVTANAYSYVSNISSVAASFTTGTVNHFYASPGSGGAGSTITNQTGFWAESTLGTAGAATVTNAYGFFGAIASGTNRWNLYMSGTANNYMAGALGIGTTTTSAALLTLASTTTVAMVTPNIAEVATVSATAATGTVNFDVTTQSVLYYTTSASGNWTLNVRGNSGTSLNTMMSTGQSITIAFLVTNGATAYYQTGFTIDGTSVTPKWQGGTAPAAGDASSVDIYTFSIVKTGSAAYTVFGTVTKFA
jgi:hypothetical protein